MNAIKITEADVGRNVVCKDGVTASIQRVYATHETSRDGFMRVDLEGGKGSYIFWDNGVCPGAESNNIVAFANPQAREIKLEAGKYYLTRDGRKAYVMGKNPFPQDKYAQFIGVVDDLHHFDDEYDDVATSWTSGGLFDDECGPHDLVAEWVEPKRVTGWLNIYSTPRVDTVSQLFKTREEADKHNESAFGREYRINCVKIDVLEGAGLEGGQ